MRVARNATGMPRDDTRTLAERLQLLRYQPILAWLQRPFKSLPSRIIMSVFAAALVTSLMVTWISTRSIESFLRAKIDQKFPAMLWSAGQRLDLWYSQRELDLATFARSDTVVDSLRAREASAAAARKELAHYLSYVLERFPQYEALFVLGRDGGQLLQVGERFELPDTWRRRLSSVNRPQVGDLQPLRDRRIQVVSAPVKDNTGRRLATLHALVNLGTLTESLVAEDLGPGGGIYVVAAGGDVLMHSPSAPYRERHELPRPEIGSLPRVEDYETGDGSRVVGSAVDFPRFGWSLVVEEPYEEAFSPVMSVIREILGINLGIVLVFGIISYQIARSIVRPILALSEGALRIATGEVNVVIDEKTSDDEIGVLTRAFNEMSAQLHENQLELEENRREIEDANARLLVQNQELQRVNEVFQQLSITDDLTKLHNHRFFQDHLPREIKRAKRTGEPLCLILIDIDDFKGVNDRFGHAVGDAVLRKVADVMNGSVRETDLLARYGGEEFVLLASMTALEGAVALAEKIRLAISRARFSVIGLDGQETVGVTASFGVAQFKGDPVAFFTDADRAVYKAKADGKNCVVTADDAPS